MKSENGIHLFHCPCCGAETIDELGTYEVCDICNWEDDPTQFGDPDYVGGANSISLNEARKAWKFRKLLPRQRKLRQAQGEGWFKVIGPNSLEERLADRKGLPVPHKSWNRLLSLQAVRVVRTWSFEMSKKLGTVVLGDEYDDRLRRALRLVLVNAGALGINTSWGIGGSQEIETIQVRLGSDLITIES